VERSEGEVPEVICLGILVADVIAKPVDVFPGRGKLVLVKQLELHTGGCASNTGIGLARIGISAGVIGKVGNDGFGDFFVKAMQREGIDTANIMREDTAITSATMVLVHGDGERSFIHCLGANAALRLADVDLSALAGSRLLHVAGSLLLPGLDGPPTAQVLKQAKARGLMTSLDTAWDSTGQWMTLIQPSLPYLDYFLPSIEEARMLTGQERPADVAAALLDHGVGVVALKMGQDGCYVAGRAQSVRLPAFDVPTVDATGAGDAFAAGFLAGVLKGWDLEQTARFANAVGALCVLAIGTTAGIKGMEETLEFMASTPLRRASS
jgi:sugar/nucleoside kinase (ribokinase family)